MTEIRADHLVVGGGILGLSVADHLLRRGAEKVVVLEASRTMGWAWGLEPGLVLASGDLAYRELEARAFLLLEEWPTYLEKDPHYRRSGSFQYPARSDASVESLPAPAARERGASFQLEEDDTVSFDARDGLIDGVALLAALQTQARSRGATILCHSELGALSDEGEAFRFHAGTRSGLAKQVYLTAGLSNVRLLSALGHDADLTLETWQCFHLAAGEAGMALHRLGEGDQGIVVALGDGDLYLYVRSASARQVEPTPDWDSLEGFRAAHEQVLPLVREAQVRRGTARNLLALHAGRPEPRLVLEGRILAHGGFGIYGTILALAAAEQMAEAGLSR